MKNCPFCAEQIQDAAVVCRFCGRDVPAPIQQPQAVGHHQPLPKWQRVVVLLSIGVIGVAFIAAAVVQHQSRTIVGPSRSQTAALAPEVSGTQAELHVRNANHLPWRDVVLMVNDEYACQAPNMAAGATEVVRTSGCANSSGMRFSPLRQVVVKVQVRAIVGDDFSQDFKTVRFRP